MSLISCSECKKEVSNKANVCPHCGNPLNGNEPIEIELTNKRWKWFKLFGWLLFILGLYMSLGFAHAGGFSNPMVGLGIFVAFVGFVFLLIAKFGSWWTNR